MLNLIEGSIMNAQGPYFALQVWTGQTKSEMVSNFFFHRLCTFFKDQGQAKKWGISR